MKTIIYSIIILFLTISPDISVKAQGLIDFESGLVFTGYNDVRNPGDDGTLFSLKDDLASKTSFFYRIRLDYTIKSRHTLSVLYAPFEIKSEGILAREVLFEEVVFPANTELEAIYKFNSYRLTYRFDIVKKSKVEFGLGFTAKIRDAKIAISSPGSDSEKTNVGFVPIINFRILWNIDNTFGILLLGDALAAPQGRAEDVLIAATLRVSDRLGVKAGYRILEGGADNDEVYNFSLFNYGSLGISYTFKKTNNSN